MTPSPTYFYSNRLACESRSYFDSIPTVWAPGPRLPTKQGNDPEWEHPRSKAYFRVHWVVLAFFSPALEGVPAGYRPSRVLHLWVHPAEARLHHWVQPVSWEVVRELIWDLSSELSRWSSCPFQGWRCSSFCWRSWCSRWIQPEIYFILFSTFFVIESNFSFSFASTFSLASFSI